MKRAECLAMLLAALVLGCWSGCSGLSAPPPDAAGINPATGGTTLPFRVQADREKPRKQEGNQGAEIRQVWETQSSWAAQVDSTARLVRMAARPGMGEPPARAPSPSAPGAASTSPPTPRTAAPAERAASRPGLPRLLLRVRLHDQSALLWHGLYRPLHRQAQLWWLRNGLPLRPGLLTRALRRGLRRGLPGLRQRGGSLLYEDRKQSCELRRLRPRLRRWEQLRRRGLHSRLSGRLGTLRWGVREPPFRQSELW